jgi:hypothetical protein
MSTTVVTTRKVTAAEIADKKTEERARNCLSEAQEFYKNIYRSWFQLGQRFLEMKEFDYYSALNFKNFKNFCEFYFPTLNYDEIIIMTRVCQDLGEAMTKRMKKADYVVPAASTCYLLVRNRENLTETNYQSLRDLVLDSGMTRRVLEEKIQEIKNQKSASSKATTKTTTKATTKKSNVTTQTTIEDDLVSLLTETEGMSARFGSVLLWMKSSPEELPESYDLFVQRVQEMWEQLDAVLAFHEKEISQ